MQPLDFYIVPEDVYRLGNEGSPRLSNVRARDVDTIEINGITVVIANSKGISVFDIEGIKLSPMSGWVWKFSATIPMPHGLKLVQDKPHHYCFGSA